MSLSRCVVTFCLPLLVVLVDGCSLRQPAPVKQSFLIQATRAQPARTPPGQTVLSVRALQVAAPFDARAFVYRRSELNYQPDFYHEFLVPPRSLLTEQLTHWLDRSGLFALVDASGRVDTPHTLGGIVSALYGDFRQKDSPKAVLAIHFVLSDERSRAGAPIWHHSYREETPLTHPTPEGLAEAWSSGLTKILGAVENDLSALAWR